MNHSEHCFYPSFWFTRFFHNQRHIKPYLSVVVVVIKHSINENKQNSEIIIMFKTFNAQITVIIEWSIIDLHQ